MGGKGRGILAGLAGPRRPQGIVQLASSLRNIGEPEAAIELLENLPGDAIIGDAACAFLALALRDAGRSDESLSVALAALARTLPLYASTIENHAERLTAPDPR